MKLPTWRGKLPQWNGKKPSKDAWKASLRTRSFRVGGYSVAAAAIVVRQKLARYRAGAPRLYLLLLAVSLGVSLVYLLAGSAVVGELLLSASTLASLAGSGVMLPVNRIYFRKRESLFAN